MKSLLLILLTSLISTSILAQNREPISMTNDERTAFLDGIYNTARGIRDERKIKYADYQKDIVEYYEDIYLAGAIKLEQFRKVEAHYKALVDANTVIPMKMKEYHGNTFVDPNHGNQVNFTGDKFKQQAELFLATFEVDKPLCGIMGDMATIPACCGDLSKMPFANYSPENSCTPRYKECNKHEDCCSKQCNKFSNDRPGKCAPEKSCYELLPEGQECTDINPYCVEGTSCLEINHSSSGVGDFIENGFACTKNAECASDKCAGGKCVLNRICTKCLTSGQKEEGTKCCPGLYKGLGGKCVPTLPPFTLPNVKNEKIKLKEEDIQRVKRILMTLVNNFIPIKPSYAREGSRSSSVTTPSGRAGRGNSTQTQPSGRAGRGSTTTTTTASSNTSNATNTATDAASNQSSESGCIEYGSKGLTTEQEAELNECLNPCIDIGEEEAKLSCLSTCRAEEQRMLQANLEAKSAVSATECSGGTLTRKDFSDLYNIPAITSKTESDVRECEFNSFNDSWISASNMEKNAEIALRAFEAVYSGDGTVDMIIDDKGRSIFERAQSVAIQLRKNRYDLIKSFQELDQKMSCKCLAVIGAQNNFKFKNENIVVNSIDGTKIMTKKDYYGQYCKADKDYLSEDGLREAQENTGGNRSGLADESVASRDDSGGDEFSKDMSSVDKGSIGLKYEKMVVEWLGLKRQVQMDRFQDNSELEDTLQELIDFIQEYKWIDGNPGSYKTANNGQAYMNKLYRFRVTYTPKWLAIVITILSVVAIIAGGILSMGAMFAAGSVFLMLGAALFANAGGSTPQLNDIKTKDGKCYKKFLGICVTKYDEYDRYLDSPEFDNTRIFSSVDASKRCKIHASPAQCVKTMYRINYKFSEEMNYENHPFLDLPMPITMDPTVFSTDKIHNGKNFAELIEYTYQEAIGNGPQDNGDDYGLRATYMSGKGWKTENGLRIPVEKKSKFMDLTLVDLVEGEENLLRMFAPENGEWAPADFTPDMSQKFKDAIEDYAICKKLGSTNQEECGVHGREVDIKDVGFGYLFENPNDAKDFAEYAYQLHFIWPHLSTDDGLGYPTIGQDAYFQSMLYNLKLVGTIALKRSMETFGAYSLYRASYDRRKRDYAGLEGVEVGSGSRNVGVSDRVFESFKGLDFSSKVNMEKFSAQMESLSADSSFTESERGLFKTASNAFKRRATDIAKREHYDKTFGSTERGKVKKERSKGFLSKLNSPLSNMGLTVGGKNVGNVDGAALGGSGSSSGKSNTSEKKSTPSVASTPTFNFKTPDYGSSGYGGSGYDSSSSYTAPDYSSENESGYGDLNKSDIEHMLKAVENEASQYQSDPNDSLFKVVSKAYKRNLSRVLVLKSSVISEGGNPQGVSIDADKKTDISNNEKESLKNLLKKSAN